MEWNVSIRLLNTIVEIVGTHVRSQWIDFRAACVLRAPATLLLHAGNRIEIQETGAKGSSPGYPFTSLAEDVAVVLRALLV
jgi:hypothetical protein